MPGDVTKLPMPAANEKQELRALIKELTERMVKALDRDEGRASEGKETASFGDLCSALDRVCGVYRLLNGTGDLDTGGAALESYREEFANGRKHPRR
jgi:hypothetical protein